MRLDGEKIFEGERGTSEKVAGEGHWRATGGPSLKKKKQLE